MPFCLETTRTTYEQRRKWERRRSMGTTRACFAANMPREPVMIWISGCLWLRGFACEIVSQSQSSMVHAAVSERGASVANKLPVPNRTGPARHGMVPNNHIKATPCQRSSENASVGASKSTNSRLGNLCEKAWVWAGWLERGESG